jgi:hypothetical protein
MPTRAFGFPPIHFHPGEERRFRAGTSPYVEEGAVKKAALAAFFCLLTAPAAGAQDLLIPYHGVVEENGLPMEGNVAINFELYDDVAMGMTPLWEELILVSAEGGHFFAVLGEELGNLLPDAVRDAPELYLGMEVQGTPLSGRQRIYAAPLAVRATDAFDFTIRNSLVVQGGAEIVNGTGAALVLHQDTSDGFLERYWAISGGGSNLVFVDNTAGTIPMTLAADAPDNAIFVDASGRVGLGTDTPIGQLHVTDGSFPSLRLEQDGSEGQVPQTWDLIADEEAICIVDTTNGAAIPFRIDTGAPTDSLRVSTSGDVGVGTGNPQTNLHVQGSGGTTQMWVEEQSGTTAARTLIRLENNGPAQMTLKNENDAQPWTMGTTSGDKFILSKAGSGNVEFDLDNTGNLTLSGSLTTSGGGTCDPGPCDGVFGPDYEVPSIDDHAADMWTAGFLPGVGPTPEGAPINVGKKTTGILNEVEHAHIYIEQLHHRAREDRKKIDHLMAKNEALEARLSRLEKALEAKK